MPTHSNEKIEFPIEYNHQWDEQVRNITGGLTILGLAKGSWIDPSGKICTENIIPVRISCTKNNIEKIIDLTIKHYDQQAVLAYQISSDVKIKYRRN